MSAFSDEQHFAPEDPCRAGGNHGLCKTHPTCELARARIADLEEQAREWRKYAWLAHGCVGLYGDDGEMQCNSCRIDFLRDEQNAIFERLAAREPSR